MAVSLVATIQRWEGLSSDIKPFEDVRAGATFHELDTGDKYKWDGVGWNLDISGPVNVKNFDTTNAASRRLVEAQNLESEFAMDGHYNFIENR